MEWLIKDRPRDTKDREKKKIRWKNKKGLYITKPSQPPKFLSPRFKKGQLIALGSWCNYILFLFWCSHWEGFNCPFLDSLDGHFKETPKRQHLPKQLPCLSKTKQTQKAIHPKFHTLLSFTPVSDLSLQYWLPLCLPIWILQTINPSPEKGKSYPVECPETYD